MPWRLRIARPKRVTTTTTTTTRSRSLPPSGPKTRRYRGGPGSRIANLDPAGPPVTRGSDDRSATRSARP